jgi:Ca2+-binding EF-hand superfamily protein
VTLVSGAQGQGLFLREDSGRVVSAENTSKSIPPEMLEHMKFLFSAFDTDSSGAMTPRSLQRLVNKQL